MGDQSAEEFEIRVPETFEEIARMTESQSPYWEYLTYAGLLRLKIDQFDDKYRDQVLRLAPYDGEKLDALEALEVLQNAGDPLFALAENFKALFTEQAMTAAFGQPGEPGDAKWIEHLTNRFAEIYERFLDHASHIRGLVVPEELEELKAATAEMSNGPIEGMRKFVDDCVRELNGLAEALENQEEDDPPIVLDLNAVIEMDPGVLDRISHALEKLTEED